MVLEVNDEFIALASPVPKNPVLDVAAWVRLWAMSFDNWVLFDTLPICSTVLMVLQLFVMVTLPPPFISQPLMDWFCSQLLLAVWLTVVVLVTLLLTLDNIVEMFLETEAPIVC